MKVDIYCVSVGYEKQLKQFDKFISILQYKICVRRSIRLQLIQHVIQI